jgi:hypothetical protein
MLIRAVRKHDLNHEFDECLIDTDGANYICERRMIDSVQRENGAIITKSCERKEDIAKRKELSKKLKRIIAASRWVLGNRLAQHPCTFA